MKKHDTAAATLGDSVEPEAATPQTIYDDPRSYAKMVRMPLSWAKLWCDAHLRAKKEMEEANHCPDCGKSMLAIEYGSYEEGTSDYVYCENDEILVVDEDGEDSFVECKFTSVVTPELEPLFHWWDFDPLLAMNCGGSNGVNDFGGLPEWFRFVKEQVSGLPKAIDANE